MNSESSLTSVPTLFLICRIMSDKVILIDYECDNNQGLGLLNQSADLEEEPMEQEDVMLLEVQPADPGHMLACSDKGIFTEVDLINSRHMTAVNGPTQEDPGVPAPLCLGIRV